MTDFYLRLEGPSRERTLAKSTSLTDVRSEAITYIGQYLVDHPAFADEGHWRLIVENEYGAPIMHVIVATVAAKGAPVVDDH